MRTRSEPRAAIPGRARRLCRPSRALRSATRACVPFALALIALASAAGVGSAATDICVVCEGPAATYRCRSDGDKFDAVKTQLKCMSDIAKTKSHQRCTIRRASDAPCEPTTDDAKTTKRPAPAAPAATTAPAQAATGPTPTLQPRPLTPFGAAPQSGDEKNASSKDKGTEPPATIEELAGRTAESSQKNLESAADAVGSAARKTGDAVGGAAKKSWDCLSSLFKNC